MDITLLKLGGSLITDKSKPYTARPEIIQQVVKEIKTVLQANPKLNLIIGHGAGSFAHQSANQYGTMNGFTDDHGKLGACVVHTDAMKLHQIVVEECMKQLLPVFSLQPAAFILSKNKTLLHANFSIIKEVLDKNMIPMIYGDVIIDTEIGSTIFSTDMLFSILVNGFADDDGYKVNQIIHAGNFDGVMDENGNVIPEITSTNFQKVKRLIGESSEVDVTGGMLKKVEESLAIAKLGIPSLIINGNHIGNIQKALNQVTIHGTKINIS